jgi:hypothetical protein
LVHLVQNNPWGELGQADQWPEQVYDLGAQTVSLLLWDDILIVVIPLPLWTAATLWLMLNGSALLMEVVSSEKEKISKRLNTK